jgi:hypothetical protein
MNIADSAEELARSFALAEGFSLHYVLVPSPVEARALLAALCSTDDRRPIEVLDPYVTWGARAERPDEPLSFDDLAADVVQLLDRMPLAVAAERRALWVDLSCVHPHDWPALGFAFARLNEGRNTIMSRLPTNVVLVLDEALARDAILGAPDVWSVRTNQHTLDGLPRAIALSAWADFTRENTTPSDPASVPARLAELLQNLAAGRAAEARRLFFALEALAQSHASGSAERLLEARGAELYRLIGDERRARLCNLAQ